jgi:hypothetical protein
LALQGFAAQGFAFAAQGLAAHGFAFAAQGFAAHGDAAETGLHGFFVCAAAGAAIASPPATASKAARFDVVLDINSPVGSSRPDRRPSAEIGIGDIMVGPIASGEKCRVSIHSIDKEHPDALAASKA